MKGYFEEVRESKDYNNYKLTADKVIQKLDSVREERTKSRRRWIWELMQNAKDVPNKYNKVSIEINLSNNLFQFKHNGDPFLVGNITGLIQQVSYGKPSNSSNRRITGKFGTGFVTTHLLSDIVYVEGIVDGLNLPPKKFKIELNRKGDTSEELIPKIREELEKLDNIESFETINNYHDTREEKDKPTVFSYPLIDEESRKAANIGVEDLANTLPQTLIFIDDQLKTVTINDNIHNQIINYERVKFDEIEKLNENENIIYATIKKEDSNNVREDFNFIIFRNEEIDLAIEVTDFERKQIKINKKSPRLFRDFPLVGSENFQFPFLLNGTKFYPTEKRDNILLEGSENKPSSNRKILEYTIEKSKQFIEWMLKNSVGNLSHIANSGIPDSITEVSVKEWYKESVQKKYRQFLLTQKVVETNNGNLSIKEAIIPKVDGGEAKNEKFWDIVSDFYGKEKLCRKEHLKSWHKNIGPSSQISSWGEDVFFTIEDLLKEIQAKQKLNEILLKGEKSSIDWLNTIYQFISDSGQTNFFNEYRIIPTISGILKSFNDDLFVETENKIPDHFITIYKDLKANWNDILIHRNVVKFDDNRASKTITDISDEINKVLNNEEINDYGQTQKYFFENENADKILIELIRVLPIQNSTSFQAKLFSLAKELLNYREQEKIIPNINDFNFKPAIRQLIRFINFKIEQANKIEAINVENSVVWLCDYLLLVQNSIEFKSLLEHGDIIPNRKGCFCALDDVKSFGTEETPLDDTLVKILYDLNSEEDWDSFLIHDSFRKLDLKSKKFDELANKIQEELEKLRLDNTFSLKSSSILNLNEWCTDNPISAQKYFSAFLVQKDKILVNISLEDKEVGKNIVKLLSNKDKLDDLVAISDTGVELSQLSKVAEIAKIVGVEEIKEIAELLLKEKEDFEFKKKIGESIEKAFIDAFKSLNLPYEITYQGIGSQDVVITNPTNQKLFYIEIKSLAPYSYYESILLSVSQAKKAVRQIEEKNYVVSVLIRPDDWGVVTVDFIKNNLKSQFDIGILLQDVIEKNQKLEEFIFTSDEIKIVFENHRRKIEISKEVWENNVHSFDDLINKIKLYLE